MMVWWYGLYDVCIVYVLFVCCLLFVIGNLIVDYGVFGRLVWFVVYCCYVEYVGCILVV